MRWKQNLTAHKTRKRHNVMWEVAIETIGSGQRMYTWGKDTFDCMSLFAPCQEYFSPTHTFTSVSRPPPQPTSSILSPASGFPGWRVLCTFSRLSLNSKWALGWISKSLPQAHLSPTHIHRITNTHLKRKMTVGRCVYSETTTAYTMLLSILGGVVGGCLPREHPHSVTSTLISPWAPASVS